MRRRDFVLAAAALAGGSAGLFLEEQRIAASVDYPGRELGHWLRDAASLPEPSETLETEVLIAGSGIAALTAAWQLGKRGFRDVLMVGGPEIHGNAAAGRDGELVFPTGAHYLPLPSAESLHIREMLAEFGMLQGDPYAQRATFDERYLVHAPADRVLYRGSWQEGYLPSDEVSAAERADHERFFSMID
jgi:NAD(P)-binding Rossmann-like domain